METMTMYAYIQKRIAGRKTQSIVGDNAVEMVNKWVNVDFTTDELNAAFERDLIDCYCRCAREMKLKSVNRDTITAAYKDIIADTQRVTREYAADA